VRLSPSDLAVLADRASAAALRVGRWIATVRPAHVSVKSPTSSPAAAIVTDVDRQAESMLVADLSDTLAEFELGLLTEEQADDRSRFARDHFWCIDPLDGTLPFTEDRFGYAVSVALVSRDGEALLGVVHDPRSDTLLRAVRGGEVDPSIDLAERLGVSRDDNTLALYCDRSLLASQALPAVRHALETVAARRKLRNVAIKDGAGAVMNACQVLADPPACYLKFPTDGPGGGSLWDFAATSCLLGEAGASARDFYGQPLDLNRPDSTFLNHRGILVCSDARLATELWQALIPAPR